MITDLSGQKRAYVAVPEHIPRKINPIRKLEALLEAAERGFSLTPCEQARDQIKRQLEEAGEIIATQSPNTTKQVQIAIDSYKEKYSRLSEKLRVYETGL